VGSSDYYALRYLRPVFGHRNIVGIDINKNAFRVGGIFADIDLVGESSTMSTSLRRKFIRSRAKNLDGYVALASKTSSTNISGTSLGEDKLTVLVLGAYFDYRDSWSGYTQATLNYSKGLPGALGAMDENGDGASSRTDASGTHAGGDFSKVNLNLARWQSLNFTPKLIHQTLLARMDMQSSKDMLVSMEQMSLGGPTSVRAYPPSEYLVDNGYFLSLEWIARSSDVGKGKFFENLQFSAFYDYATGELNDPLVNDVNAPKLQGIGASAQVTPNQKYLARLELAKPIGDPEPSNNRSIQYFFKMGYLF
jgi:hemolysin activation/secretion protein